jgi:hypothetical protein
VYAAVAILLITVPGGVAAGSSEWMKRMRNKAVKHVNRIEKTDRGLVLSVAPALESGRSRDNGSRWSGEMLRVVARSCVPDAVT